MIIGGLRRALKPSNRSLIRELVVSDFKMRYQGSVLGYLWSLLKPLMLFGVLYIVFTKIVKLGAGIHFYPAYLLLGIVLWTFFVEATMSGMRAIVDRGDLIRKINIPKYTIVISTTFSAGVNFVLNMLVVFVFMLFSGVHIEWHILWAIPLIGELVVLALGLSFFLAALYVKFRDISHIWEVILQIMFYAVPIIYLLSMPMPQWIREFTSMLPITQILQDLRAVMITPETLTTKEVFGSIFGRLGPMLLVVTIAVLASLYFRRASRRFAEEL